MYKFLYNIHEALGSQSEYTHTHTHICVSIYIYVIIYIYIYVIPVLTLYETHIRRTQESGVFYVMK